MITLSDLFDLAEMDRLISEHYITARRHPNKPLTILNYSPLAQYENLWTPETMQCRGLIHDSTGRVIARPFPKFFSHQQGGCPVVPLDEPCRVMDKMDGSLGILYHDGDDWAIATRGSFDSEQAKWATAWFRKHADFAFFRTSTTYLFEILARWNRIVVEYDWEGLVLIACVEIKTGKDINLPQDPWLLQARHPPAYAGVRQLSQDSHTQQAFKVVETFPCSTYAEALAMPPRKNHEGLVVFLPRTQERIKIKQEDYLALHRIVTGLNERSVWEHLKEGGTLGGLIDSLPDEFHEWVGEVYWRLLEQRDNYVELVETVFTLIVRQLPPHFTSKEFALHEFLGTPVKDLPIAGMLFACRDVRDYEHIVWDLIKPPATKGPREGARSRLTLVNSLLQEVS